MKRIIFCFFLLNLCNGVSFSTDIANHSKTKVLDKVDVVELKLELGVCTETVGSAVTKLIQKVLKKEKKYKIFPLKFRDGKPRRRSPFFLFYYTFPKNIKGNLALEQEFAVVLRDLLKKQFIGPGNRAILCLHESAREVSLESFGPKKRNARGRVKKDRNPSNAAF